MRLIQWAGHTGRPKTSRVPASYAQIAVRPTIRGLVMDTHTTTRPVDPVVEIARSARGMMLP
jgi:hypothetical protein